MDETTKEHDISVADVAEAASSPSSFSVEGLSQSNRPVSEMIAAYKFVHSVKGARRRRHPLSGMVSHLIPPGTCDR